MAYDHFPMYLHTQFHGIHAHYTTQYDYGCTPATFVAWVLNEHSPSSTWLIAATYYPGKQLSSCSGRLVELACATHNTHPSCFSCSYFCTPVNMTMCSLWVHLHTLPQMNHHLDCATRLLMLSDHSWFGPDHCKTSVEFFLSLSRILLYVCAQCILSLIHIWRCRRSTLCRSRWSPYH